MVHTRSETFSPRIFPLFGAEKELVSPGEALFASPQYIGTMRNFVIQDWVEAAIPAEPLLCVFASIIVGVFPLRFGAHHA